MPIKAIQQFQLRAELQTENKARETLRLARQAGYEGIELNGFMIKKMGLAVRAITRLAGMPMGKSGRLNWEALIQESGLSVVSIHEDLGTITRVPEEVIAEAKAFGTSTIVVTGMHRFNYADKTAVLALAQKLNKAGEQLAVGGVRFLYHNHNAEFRKVAPNQTAYDLLMEETDPAKVGFEFDSYWPAEAGVNALALMQRLGKRMELWHINDRGTRLPPGPTGSILKSDSMELGHGNMDLLAMLATAKEAGVRAVVLESHRNWAEKSAIKSMQLSAAFMKQYV